MSSFSYVKKILDEEKKFFTTLEIGKLLELSSLRTVDNVVARLVKENVLLRLEKGKYVVVIKDVSDFEVAQFLYSPSYISFETALNYHGVLSQFPFELTSVTNRKRARKKVRGKMFSYSKVKPDLFVGYYKEGGFLMAFPEKALFDQLYMVTKSFKTSEYLDEMDYSRLKLKKMNQYMDLVTESTAREINRLIEEFV